MAGSAKDTYSQGCSDPQCSQHMAEQRWVEPEISDESPSLGECDGDFFKCGERVCVQQTLRFGVWVSLGRL